MVIRNSNDILHVNSKSLEQFFSDCLKECRDFDEVKKVSKIIRTVIDISAVDAMERLGNPDPYDIY